jgi:hypothetical protein
LKRNRRQFDSNLCHDNLSQLPAELAALIQGNFSATARYFGANVI